MRQANMTGKPFCDHAKGSVKTGVIYRREWSKSKYPFLEEKQYSSRNREDTDGYSKSYSMLFWNLCSLCSIHCFACEWLSQSLWSRQQRCKMAAARDIYMETLNGSNSTCICDECYICNRCWCTRFIWHWPSLLIQWFKCSFCVRN